MVMEYCEQDMAQLLDGMLASGLPRFRPAEGTGPDNDHTMILEYWAGSWRAAGEQPHGAAALSFN